MAQYLLSIFHAAGPGPVREDLDRIMAEMDGLNQEIRAAGAWVFTGGLHPPTTATVIRPQADDLLMTDGPFVEGKEHVGGFTVIEAADLDAALGWGGKLARVTGLPIEVRPFQDPR
jgi:hypothetical protein